MKRGVNQRRFKSKKSAFAKKFRPGGGEANKPGHKFHSPHPRSQPHRHHETHEVDDFKFDFEKAKSETAKAIQNWQNEAAKDLENRQRSKTGHPDVPINLIHTLDEWQLQAFEALQSGKNVIVDAPTTAGKTRIVEVFFQERVHSPGFRAAYTSPVKSLSNDKLREFRQTFGENNVGIATGDIKENLNAPIVVATLETYRNSLLGTEPDLRRSLVVFDEYHFMQDIGRGSSWEEAIVLTPPNCQLLLTSASVANAEKFCAWLEKIHKRPCVLVRTTHRPVPLVDLVYLRDEWLLVDQVPKQKLFKHPDKQLLPLPHKHLAPRLVKLIDLNLTPTIIYCGRRIACESVIDELVRQLPPLKDQPRRHLLDRIMAADTGEDALRMMPAGFKKNLETYGVAYHHSGLIPKVRQLVEFLLKEGELRFVSATMGLSLGINFSVRSTLISDFKRPSELGLTAYPPSEILQMLGRAGRRGKDKVGFSLWPSTEQYAMQGNAKREDCYSQLRNDPTTFLGLVSRGFDLRALENFYAKSFRRFADDSVDLSLIRKERVLSKLNAKEIPCSSPAREYALYQKHADSLCVECPQQKKCHTFIKAKINADLSALHLHLHRIGALTADEGLSPYGEIAKFFPHTGGLLLAKYFEQQKFDEKNFLHCAELMAALSMARFKQVGADSRYQFPFDSIKIEESLEELYPYSLFPEIYDPPFGKRRYPILREFNPDAGFAIRAWSEGWAWQDLERVVVNEKFNSGDLVSMVYRVGTYLQSLSQAHIGEISKWASALRSTLLREHLSLEA